VSAIEDRRVIDRGRACAGTPQSLLPIPARGAGIVVLPTTWVSRSPPPRRAAWSWSPT